VTTTAPAAPATAAPLRRPLWGLLGGTALSVSANAMVAVLIPWLVLARTGSPAQAGVVSAVALAAAVPALLAGGLLLDRLDRRRLSIGADLASAAAVLALPLLDATVGLTLLAICACVAAGAVFDGPGLAAREALRPAVARSAGVRLERVNARDEVAQQLGEVAGPALAGVGLAVVGATGSLWAAGAVFVAAAAATAVTLPRSRTARRPAERLGPALAAGLRTVWHDRVLRTVALADTAFAFFLAPLVLVLATHLQGTDRAGALGLVLAAFAVGGVAGALGYGTRPATLRRRTWLTGGLALASAGLLLMATLPPPWALAGLATLVGLAAGPVNPVLAVVVQDRVPDRLLGRVVATLGALGLLAAPAGALGAGLLLQVASPSVALAVTGLGCLATTAGLATAPTLRRIERTDLQEMP
jgi:MFS family permease